MNKDQIIARLKDFVGADNVLLDESSRKQKAVDLYALRLYQKHLGWQPVMPMLVIRPGNTGEVSEILAFANENKLRIIPYGGGSGVLAGAETIYEDTIVIDLSRLNTIQDVHDQDLNITCGAGTRIKDLEARVNSQGYVLGHYPQSMDQAQMGGLVATRSIGQFSTGYGGIEDFLLGLEAVLPNGEVVKVKANPRTACGPDLKHVFLGSEGTFGIVTEVTVKVFPQPENRWKGSYRVRTMDEGLEIIRLVMRTGIKPSVIRLHDWLECEKPYGAFMEEGESLLIFLSEGRKDVTDLHGQIIEKIALDNGGIAAGPKPVDIWFTHRNDAADEYEQYGSQGIMVDTIEVSGNWSQIADIYNKTVERVYYEVPEVLFFSGHSSHSYMNGTNIYFQLGAFPPPDIAEAKRVYDQVWDITMESTLEHGGAIAHHHGIGKQRVKYLPGELGNGIDILRAVKDGLDPQGIMNPGALLAEK